MHPNNSIYLITERLLLKPHTLANLPRLNAWFNDPELSYYDGDDPPRDQPETLEETRLTLDRILNPPDPPGTLHYAIHKKSDDDLVGYGMVAHIDRYNRRCDLGLTLGEKSEWGQGYAREALQAVIAFCFEQLNMNRLGASMYDFNWRSIRLFESLGFQREGVLHQYVFKDGIFKDELQYRLIKEEFRLA